MEDEVAWRKFEKLVAQIEAQAASRGAVVKWNDKIPDIDTGEERQVDVSIRQRLGTVDILIIIECKKHKRKSDVQMIESLAARQKSVGAAKAIAVSEAGFTKPAETKASKLGIELRVMEEISYGDIDAWITGKGVVHLFRQIEDVTCEIGLKKNPRNMLPIDPEIPIFFHKLVASPFPAVVFLQFLELKEANRFWSIPLDGTKTRLTFDLDATAQDLIPVPLSPMPRVPSGELNVESDGSRHTVEKLRLSALVSYESAVFSPNEGKHYNYQGTPNVQHTVFEGEMFEHPVRFDHQFGIEDEQSVSINFRKRPKPENG